ncbi:MAG: putative Ig domain-containing protein [Oscillospiraceae bacterium]|nr:putative Ig domain-containing protein [Oscillospiraceae bacterium]
MGKFQKPKEKKSTEQKKQTRKYFRLTITGILVVLLAVMPMLASQNAETDRSQASILSATVEYKDIDTQIIGGGQLSSEASLNVRIPENVKLTQYLVGNGDTVKEGDAIAKVDKVSVMTAITEVQETLDYLAEEIAAASGDTASTSVKALAGGTVKVIYANEGESVQDVMLDHGALAVLSLDDTMAVKIEKETNLDVGDTVVVTLPDGTEADGRVKTNLEGVLTITMDDDNYSVGAKVTVSTESGEELGTGELYVFSPWSATAYSGTISDVLVAENDTVAIGRVLFTLEDTGNSAQFQRLIDQRQEYEELMQELFTMYRTETITAPCDGIVTGVDEDGAYLLADDGNGWFVNLLSFFGPEKDGFVAYAVTVTEVTASGTELRINPKAMYIEDLAAASGLYVDVNDTTESWTYNGEIAVYTQDENGLLHSSGSAKAGDILLAIGDEEQVRWFVKLDESSETGLVTQTENSRSRFLAFLLSDEEVTEEFSCDGTNCNLDASAEGHAPGCSKIVQDTPVSICNGADGCTLDVAAEGHLPGCNKVVTTVLEESDSVCNGVEGCALDPDAQGHIEGCDNYVSVSLLDNEQAAGNCNGGSGCTLDENATGHTVGCQNYTPTITLLGETSVLVNTQYSATVTLSDTMEGNWSVTPDWLLISDGTITGTTPTAAGSYTVTVTFTPTTGKEATASLTLTVMETSTTPSVPAITTEMLAAGVVGQSYTYPMQVSGSTAGTWSAENLPGGLVIHEQTGVISGTPTYEGTFTVKVTYTDTATQSQLSKEYVLKIVTAETTVYTGYVAQIVEIKDSWAKVKQTLYSYTITDLSKPPKVSASAADLTVEREYTSELIKTNELAVGDTFLIVVNNKGTVRLVSKDAIQESQGAPGQQTGTNTGGTASDGMSAGGGMTGGMGQVQTFEPYSLEKLTVASVTSQEHMTVSITIDELDITKIYVGQAAVVSVDALGGEQFDAEITKVSNSGENEGGNSKFTVEVTLGKSGEMLPGMYSSAFITLETCENVPCVPVAALGKDGVDSILYTSYDAETGTLGDPVVVSIGVSDGENVQILEGFTAGETCYYEYFDTYVGSDSPQQQGRGFNFGRMLGGR